MYIIKYSKQAKIDFKRLKTRNYDFSLSGYIISQLANGCALEEVLKLWGREFRDIYEN